MSTANPPRARSPRTAGDRVVRVLAAVGRIAVGVVAGSGEDEPGAVGIGDGQRAVGPGGDAAATRTDPDLGLEAQPVVLQRAPYGQPVSSCGRGEVAARRGVAQGEGDPSRAVRSEPPGDDGAGVETKNSRVWWTSWWV